VTKVRVVQAVSSRRVTYGAAESFKTVEKQRRHLMSKLDIHDIAGLTRYAIAEGIIESSAR